MTAAHDIGAEPVTITTGRRVTMPQAITSSTMTRGAFAAELARRAEGAHDGSYYSLASYPDRHRHDESYTDGSALVLDYDALDGPDALGRVRDLYAGMAGAMHTTRHHHYDRPSVRVVLWTSRPITAEEYRAIYGVLARRSLAAGLVVDANAKAASQPAFFPGACNGAGCGKAERVDHHAVRQSSQWALAIEGDDLDVDDYLERAAIESEPAAPEPKAAPSEGLRELTPKDVVRIRGFLRDSCDVVRATPKDSHDRNNTLAKEAEKAGAWVHYGVYSEAEAVAALLDAAREGGWDFGPGSPHPSTARRQVAHGATRPQNLPPEKPREAKSTCDAPPPVAMGIENVLTAWSREGPLVHEPTGLPELDGYTDGGPVYGSRWYLTGAPDACKTAGLVHIADTYLERGIAVGLLAVDEEPGDLVMRFAQRRGFSRHDCEKRAPETLYAIHEQTKGLRLRLYSDEWTIERAAADLATFAEGLGVRAMLGIDSIQTVRCEGEDASRSVREVVTARAVAMRAMATRYKLITIATSEMNRGAYRSIDAAEQTDDLASAKESGAIEYSARVMLSLRSVKGEPDLIEAKIAKNKHGPRDVRFYLTIDRARQELSPAEPPEHDDQHDGGRGSREREINNRAAAAVALALVDAPGLTARALRAELAARLGRCSRERCDAAVALLKGAVITRPGDRRALHHYLDGSAVADEILAALEPDDRARVGTSTPPPEASSC